MRAAQGELVGEDVELRGHFAHSSSVPHSAG
jgi:hypothetical protein